MPENNDTLRSGIPAPELFDLTGRVGIVTGGAGMLGLSYAEAIAEAGGTPVLFDLDQSAIDAALALLVERTGRTGVGLLADVSVKEDVDAAVAAVVDRLGRIDMLVNNAALTVRGGSEGFEEYFAAFEDYPLDLWKRAVEVNLTGTFLVTQAVGRVMVAAGSGSVVNISSVYGNVAPDQRIYDGIANQYGGAPFNTPISYSTTKAAMLNFTRHLAVYWAQKGVRVNTFSPGAVYDNHDPAFVANLTSRIPLGRMARQDEYKGVLLFLLSDASSYVTGANVVADGGWISW